jgi:hypothetical protein
MTCHFEVTGQLFLLKDVPELVLSLFEEPLKTEEVLLIKNLLTPFPF